MSTLQAQGLSVEVDKASVASIQKDIKRLETEVGKDLGQAVLIASWYISKAARAATKLSRKKHRIVPNPRYNPNARSFSKFSSDFKNGNRFSAEKLRQDGTRRLIPIFGAETPQEARQSPLAEIKRRGMAQDAWSWISKALGTSAPSQRNRITRRHAGVDVQTKSVNPSVLIEDNLKYASLAFRTRGRATVNDIMSRAAARLRATVERKIAGKIR